MPYCIYAQCIGRRDFQPAPGRVGRFQNQKDCGTNSVLPSLSSGGKVDQSTNLPSRAVLWKLNCVSCGHDAARFEARGSEGVNPCVARVPIVREETERCKVGFTTLSPFASAPAASRGSEGGPALRRLGDAHVAEPPPVAYPRSLPRWHGAWRTPRGTGHA